MNKSKLKEVIAASLALLGVMASCMISVAPSEDWIRGRVVKLVSANGSCSGEQVEAPSGMTYILTAAHCKILSDSSGSITAITEDGKSLQRKIIAEDAKSDLLLLEGVPHLPGLSIARASWAKEEVRTFTHGAGLATYKTQGVLIQDKAIQVLVRVLFTADDEAECKAQPKYEAVDFFGFLKVCVMNVVETVTTAMVVPGSSGGMVVDAKGQLVGVVSAGGEGFGYLVPLNSIRAFLANY